MTKKEVEEILGGPGRGWIGDKRTEGKIWVSEECFIEVRFERRTGTVVGKVLTELPRRTPLERLRKWLGV